MRPFWRWKRENDIKEGPPERAALPLCALIFLGLASKVKGDHHRKDGEELVGGQPAGNGQMKKAQRQKQGDQILYLHHAVQKLFHSNHLTKKDRGAQLRDPFYA